MSCKIVILILTIILAGAGMYYLAGGEVHTNIFSKRGSGLEIATTKFDALKRKYPAYSLNRFRECKSNTDVIYDVEVGGGFGGGERYVYSQTGEEIWYRHCKTAPNDDCEVVRERGVPPNFGEYECSILSK